MSRTALALAAGLGYLALVLAVGVWAARRTRSARDFFIAGQNVGVLVTGVATMASAFSGFVFLGGPGLAYRIGIASLLVVVPLSFTSALLGWTVGKRLRLVAEVREVFTVPDALRVRYGSAAVAAAAAVAIGIGSIAYLGAQVQALGVLLEATLDVSARLGAWSAPAAMGAGLVVLLLYSVRGGMVAGVYTDLVQGALMMLAAVAVFWVALQAGGGFAEMTRTLAASPRFGADFLDPLGGLPAATGLGFFLVFSLGVLGQPHMLHKLYMLEDVSRLRWLPLVVAAGQSVCILLWLGVGLAVPALVASGRLPPLEAADQAAPSLLLLAAPPALLGLAFAGVLAAVMSTADSFLNLAAAAVVRDLPRALGRPLADELRWGRWATVAAGLAAGVVAWLWADLIALLATFAFGTFAAALGPAVAVGWNWARATPAAALASIVVGAGLNLLLEVQGRLPQPLVPLPPGVLGSAVALLASFVVFFAVSLWGPRAAPLPADVRAVLEA